MAVTTENVTGVRATGSAHRPSHRPSNRPSHRPPHRPSHRAAHRAAGPRSSLLHRSGPRLLLAAIHAGAAAVVALWWSNTESVVGVDGWLTNAGRITGLLAGYGCAVLVGLMARVPALDRGLGTDRLARWHAMGGRYVVSLVVAHALLIIFGSAMTAQTDPVTRAEVLVLDTPGMLKAAIGTGLLIGVGIVSARAARRRLRYEVWHVLHLSTYVALYLSFGHQLAYGADLLGNRPAQIAWYVLYGGVAVLLVWYRAITPVRRTLRHRMRVAEVRQEAPGVVSVYLTGRDLDQLRAESGQFFRWRFLAPGMWWAANPFSLSAAPRSDYLRITVKEAGGHSRAIAGLRPGTKVWAEGPYGALTAARRSRRKVLLLAGGVGITPLRSLFESLPAQPGDLTLVYRARRPEDLALRQELDAIAAKRGARVHYAVSEPAGYALPLTSEALSSVVPGLRGHDVYLCGPPGMTDAALTALKDAGVPRRNIHHESFEL